MVKIFFLLLFLMVTCGCSNNNSANIGVKDNPNNDSLKNHNSSDPLNEIPDFLKLINDENPGYKGFLQGVNQTDSSGPYTFSEYYGDTLSFELFYLPKYLKKEDITFDSIEKARANNYKDYTCLSFVYPMQNPDKMKDYHADNVTYPVHVKCYIRKELKWHLLAEVTAKDLTELSRFKIKYIYLQ